MTKLKLLCAAALAGTSLAASADAKQFVTNGDFTDLTHGVGQIGYNTTAVGWTSGGLLNVVMSSADAGAPDQFGTISLWDNTNYIEGPTGDPCGTTDGVTFNCNPVGNSWNGDAAGAGNFVAMDADYHTGPMTQTITNLAVGDTYTLTFDYAFAQQTTFNGDTVQSLTETLGGQSYTTSTVDLPSHGFSGWQSYTTTITATSTTETLSFLAAGNLPVPPFALVSNVSLIGAPEPASWALMIVGIGALGAVVRHRRAASAAAA